MSKPFDRVQLAGACGPAFPADMLKPQAADQWMAGVKAAGVTEVQINWLSGGLHPMLQENPTSLYMGVMAFGPSLDQYVSSRLFEGTYHPRYLAANMSHLKLLGESARRHDIKPMMFCSEPRLAPERFFQKYPTLRGPRVDNPTLGMYPFYAMCTDKPEVRAHYSEMTANLLKEIPDIACISLFSQDCGTGFCYGEHLYAGPNGAGFCRPIPYGRRVVAFCEALIEGGRSINPSFDVIMTSSHSEGEREAILQAATEGVSLASWGQYSWLGGMEDWWGHHQYHHSLPEVGPDRARQERFDEFRARVEVVLRNNKAPVGIYSGPTDQFHRPCRFVPTPQHNLRILEALRDMGVKHLQLRGQCLNPNEMPYDVNRETQRMFLEGDTTGPDEMIAGLAGEWAGDSAGALLQAWKLSEQAICEEAMWDHSLAGNQRVFPGPLVPDHAMLTDEQWQPFDQPQFAERDKLKGPAQWCTFITDEPERLYTLRQYQNSTLPDLAAACEVLRDAAAGEADSKSKQALELTRKHLVVSLCWRRTKYHWLDMSRFRDGQGPRSDGPGGPGEVVDAEIANSKMLAETIRGDQPALFSPDYGKTDDEATFMTKLAIRHEVMAAHRDDPPKQPQQQRL